MYGELQFRFNCFIICSFCVFIILRLLFNRTIVSMTYTKDTNEVARPSELLSKLKAHMAVLQSVENYVHLGKFSQTHK